MKTSLGRRGLSLFLTLVLCLTLAPAVFAAGETPVVALNRSALTMYMLELETASVTEQLTAKVTRGNVTLRGPVTWSSSDDNVVSVADDGFDTVQRESKVTITARKAGTATITASYVYQDTSGDTPEEKTVTATCSVTVVAPQITAIRVSLEKKVGNVTTGASSSIDLAEKDEVTLTARVTPVWSDGGSHTAPAAFADRLSYRWGTVSGGGTVLSVAGGNTASTTVTANAGGQDTVTLTASYELPDGSGANEVGARCTINVAKKMKSVSFDTDSVILEVGSTREIKVTPEPSEAAVNLSSTGSAYFYMSGSGTTRVLTGLHPGEGTITATIGSGDNMAEDKLQVEVSGLVARSSQVSVRENSVSDLPAVDAYGSAKGKAIRWESKDPGIVQISGQTVRGLKPGTANVVAYVGTDYEASVSVTVSADTATTIGPIKNFKTSDTLSFGDYLSNFRRQADGNLSHLTGLRVDPAQGTLYYRYNTANGPEGVSQTANYYDGAIGNQKDLSQITFVPKADYAGKEITISYTVISDTYRSTNGRIILEMERSQASNEMYLTATHNYPARFSSEDFNRICQQNYGAALSYVTFSLPPSGQGTLYTDYVSEQDYGSKVTTGTQYRRQDLDKVFFVPAEGFSGTATIYYTARAVGTPGATYSGQVIITVSRDSGSAENNLVYSCYAGSYVTLDDARFNDYWRSELKGSGSLNYIRFDALPSASQGTLYYRYRSASNTGSAVQTGVNYYYGTYTPRLDYVSFVPDSSFSGVVYIPFTGYSSSGDRFSGRIEIDVTGTGGSGNVWYSCRPGRTVDFNVNDFSRLSNSLTGRDVDYIKFEGLPNSSTQGSLYHNSSRITSASRNYYRSGTYRIGNLSFRASSSFSGVVDIPFTGRSANGINFEGVLTISSSGSENWDSNIYYTTDYAGAAVFDRDDFDELSQLESDRNVSTVWFTDIPSTTEGSLYRNYYSSSSRGTRISSNNTSISASSLDRVAFVPASGFTGTVYLPFRARSASGDDFYGTVQVDVGRPSAAVTARYTTWTSPVNLRSQDLRRNSTSLNYVRFTAMPSASEGRLYYRYTSPTQYESRASAGTSYYTSGGSLISNLTFVPRAGFTGTVYIPYTGTNTNGTTFEGEVAISVSPTYGSNHFSDMGRYDSGARAAVEYLYNLGVTKGISSTQYGPELPISRADFAVMVYNAFGFSPSGSYQVFSDVPTGTYYTQAVNTLYSRGIVGGIGGGLYSPNTEVSRQDAVCMVHRAMRSIGWSTNNGSSALLNAYSDGGSVSDYARSDMINAIWQGYLPTANGRLDYNASLSRVDMAQMLHRVLTY